MSDVVIKKFDARNLIGICPICGGNIVESFKAYSLSNKRNVLN
ncbi:hypothetical protein [Clostridium estertheticum]|nr:hypothetical protein [Clostridium estertheticum]